MTHNPHDHLVRAIFGCPAHAAGELRAVLPPPLLAKLDLTTLTLVSGTFIDAKLRDRETDLLFTVRAMVGTEWLVYRLLEHQSSVDSWIPLRLLEYQLQIWERWRSDHPGARRLPRIVPVVLYHGERAWIGSTRFGDLLDRFDPGSGVNEGDGDVDESGERAAAELRSLSVDFGFILDDLTRCPDEKLLERALDATALLTLLFLKHAPAAEDLCELLLSWVWLMNAAARGPDGRKALERLFRYLALVSKRISPTFVKEKRVPRLDDENAREAGLTLAEQWIEEGREKGQLQGRRDLLRHQLERRFGELPRSAIERVEGASAEQIDGWAVRIFEVGSLAELLIP